MTKNKATQVRTDYIVVIATYGKFPIPQTSSNQLASRIEKVMTVDG